MPWVSAGGTELLGGVVQLKLEPAVDFDDLRLPATISPNQKAPPATPTIYRFALMSATNVSKLEVAVRLADGRAVGIEPSGDGYRVTKLETDRPAAQQPGLRPGTRLLRASVRPLLPMRQQRANGGQRPRRRARSRARATISSSSGSSPPRIRTRPATTVVSTTAPAAA